jgi:tetratricopeptide (TPR) repeat protein
VSLFPPQAVADDRILAAPRAASLQKRQRKRGHPGSDLSFGSGSAIKRITALMPSFALSYAQGSMSRNDWYRNTVWNDQISNLFFTKLARARDKSQYLRIQASTLAPAHPEVALELLRRYFALGEHFDQAQAYVDQATAYVALGEQQRAVEAYERAHARERKFPNARTPAVIDLPL